MKCVAAVLFALIVLSGCADSGVHELNGIKGVRVGSPLRQYYMCGNMLC